MNLLFCLGLMIAGAGPLNAETEGVERSCASRAFTEEVKFKNGYHLRYKELSNGKREYFVYSDLSACNFVLKSRINPEHERIHMLSLLDLTVPSQYVEPARIRISRFLTDRELEAQIVASEFKTCRREFSRRVCIEMIEERTRGQAVTLAVRKSGRIFNYDFYLGDGFYEGEKVE